MALDLPRSQFFHIQKTGGTWVREAVRAAGLPANEIGPVNFFGVKTREHLNGFFYHAAPRNVHGHGKFRFAFVRNPLTWYQSMWAFLEKGGWQHHQFPPAPSFHAFIEAFLERDPGYLSRTYARYEHVDWMGRYESLEDDLVKALTMAGETFDEAALRSTKPLNAASRLPEWAERCAYTDELRARVVEAEKEAFETYGFSTEA